MNLPVMEEISASRDMIQEFGGYNRNFRIGDGEFYDMENLTGDDSIKRAEPWVGPADGEAEWSFCY